MFRYSRDVKRCGPGTKAGAPVGVVYCLSTSSFFILKLTLEFDVSAFGNGDRILAAFLAGRQYGPSSPSLQAGSLRKTNSLNSPALQHDLVPASETRPVSYIRRS